MRRQVSKHYNLLVFGAPGVGKGTYSKLITKEFSTPTFSMGDYLRGILAASKQQDMTRMDPLSAKISQYMKSGLLIDDQIVVDVVKNLHEDKDEFMDGKFRGAPGIILDGVPRTVNQAKMINEFMNIDVIINFQHREEEVLAKILGRRICPNCDKNFNVAHIYTADGHYLPPLLPKGPDPTRCDGPSCNGAKLVKREDDNEETVRNRLAIYAKETLPILDFYHSQDNTTVIDFEAKRGKADFPIFKELIEDALVQQNWLINRKIKM